MIDPIENNESGASVRGKLNAMRESVNTRDAVKVYRALLTQEGTNDPDVVILENTIGAIEWLRTNQGTYVGVLTGAFTINKTLILTAPSPIGGDPGYFQAFSPNANQITITTASFNDGLLDDMLLKASIEIRVYP